MWQTANQMKNKKKFYDRIISTLYDHNHDQQTKIFFLDAPGGTGKKWLMKLILAHVRGNGDIAIAVAFSGIAALLMPGGRTIHSTFDLPIKITSKSFSKIKRRNSIKAKILQQAKIIIVDEAPMANKNVLECLDRSLQYICNSKLPFAGKTVILSGDFRQI